MSNTTNQNRSSSCFGWCTSFPGAFGVIIRHVLSLNSPFKMAWRSGGNSNNEMCANLHKNNIVTKASVLSALQIDTAREPPWLFGHSDGASIALLHTLRRAHGAHPSHA